MKKQLFFLVIVFAAVVSCKTTTSNVSETLPVPTGTLQGDVILSDEFGNYLLNYSGVIVSLDSTSYVGVTDNNGAFSIKNVPINAFYNITFSKAGFGSEHIPDFNVIQQSGSAPLILNNPNGEGLIIPTTLYQKSSTTVQSFTAVATPGAINMTSVISNNSPSYPSNSFKNSIGSIVFVNTQPTVSSSNYINSPIRLYKSATTDTAKVTYYPYPVTFPAGTTLYLIAYGYSGNYSISDLNPNPSAVVSVVTE